MVEKGRGEKKGGLFVGKLGVSAVCQSRAGATEPGKLGVPMIMTPKSALPWELTKEHPLESQSLVAPDDMGTRAPKYTGPYVHADN